MDSAAAALDYIQLGLRFIGLETYVELNVYRRGDSPWELKRSGKGLRFHCDDFELLDEVVAAILELDHTVEPTDQTGTVVISPSQAD